MGAYYGVSDKRKRSAIAKVAQHTFNHRGKPRPPVDASTYQLRSLAVPYGNCTEPANVKSGGRRVPSASNVPAAASTDPIRRTSRRLNRKFTRCARIMNGHWR